jgi:hypothetical protein
MISMAINPIYAERRGTLFKQLKRLVDGSTVVKLLTHNP